METSDESFVWTDASSDSSTKMEIKQNKSRRDTNGNEKSLNLNEAVRVQQKQKSRKRKKEAAYVELETNTIDFDIDTSIKSEPNSDFDMPKSKRKKINHEDSECNGTLQEAENYLNLRVKQEQITFVEPTSPKFKKKKKCKNESEMIENGVSEVSTPFKKENDFGDDLHESFLNNCNDTKIEVDNNHRKKKKKKKTLENATIEACNRTELEVPDNINKVKKKTLENATIEACNRTELEVPDNINKVKKKSVKKKSYSSKELIDDNSESDVGEIVSSTLINNSINAKNTMDNVSALLGSTVNQISIIEGALSSSRISDRIRFEEEEESIDFESKEYVPNGNLLNQLHPFISTNTNLKPFQCSLANPGITDDDEIWILKGPHAIPASNLNNCSLTLDDRKKVKVSGKSYDSAIDNSFSNTSILLLNKTFLIKTIHLMGMMTLRQRLPKVHIPYETLLVNTKSSFIPLPDTKCRHPLFGANYKRATKIRADIAERLHVTESSNYALRSEKRKKIRKKEKIEIESEIDLRPSVDAIDSHKKKRKRKNRDDQITPRKQKRIKKDPCSADAWGSERAIEENLFNF